MKKASFLYLASSLFLLINVPPSFSAGKAVSSPIVQLLNSSMVNRALSPGTAKLLDHVAHLDMAQRSAFFEANRLATSENSGTLTLIEEIIRAPEKDAGPAEQKFLELDQMLSASSVGKKITDEFAIDPFAEIRNVVIQLPSGKEVRTRLAITEKERFQGLSGMPSEEFAQDQGMLFVLPKGEEVSFWMYDTWFDLTIVFLNRDLQIVGVEPRMKHHPGKEQTPEIEATRPFYAHYVLEVKADASVAKEMVEGVQLRLMAPHSISRIKSHIQP